MQKLTPQLFKCHNLQLLIASKQQRAFFWGAAMAALSVIIALAAICKAQPEGPAPLPKPAQVKQVHDRDSGKAEKLPIATSDDVITVSFHNCRENAKHHWSCQMVEGDDTDHFVYLPGLHPKNVQPSSESTE